ncbi:hypothetical protein B0T26DRAFT_693626 [Lasiosphaeria miniovina]|uniref:Telomeric single stranded DNA binding POT1/Cdc13 domain-containing protein n=1 Tax=Lasiosphaeria miniovina TaxID=1954250 RepID=A0AA40B4A8_9PEZI|nr:uncharacterized protein B0T26DRAFT_693626 [Lasiosphaeria miniovina]KAK0727232.1 hypothetical protein B0T26DRAFT_693626 [Lasiosphaeria miniovina]
MSSADQVGALLASRMPTPIAQLNPDFPDQASCVVRGEVTITWPYSIVNRTFAFLLAEPDVLLRRVRGQVRIELHGSSAKAVADCGLGGGDEVYIGLDGVRWAKDDSPGRIPGARLDWQLQFDEKLALKVNFLESGEQKCISIDHPQPEVPKEIVAEPQLVSTPAVRRIADFEADEYPSPAFLKRARISYGDGGVKGRGRKRTRFGRDSSAWRYTSQSPNSPRMADECVQTLDIVAPETWGVEATETGPTPVPATASISPDTSMLDAPAEAVLPSAIAPPSATSPRATPAISAPASSPPMSHIPATDSEVPSPPVVIPEEQAQKQPTALMSDDTDAKADANADVDMDPEVPQPTARPTSSVAEIPTSLFGVSAPTKSTFSMFGTKSHSRGDSNVSLADQVRFGFSHIPTVQPRAATDHPIPIHSDSNNGEPEAYPESFLDAPSGPVEFADMTSYLNEAEAHLEIEPIRSHDIAPEPHMLEHFDHWNAAIHAPNYSVVEVGSRTALGEPSLGSDSIKPTGIPEGFASYGVQDGAPQPSPLPKKSYLPENDFAKDVDYNDEDAEYDERGAEIEEGDYDQRNYNVPADDDEGVSDEDNEINQEIKERYGQEDIYDEDEEDEEEEGESEGYDESDEDQYHSEPPRNQAATSTQKKPIVISLLSDSEDDDEPPPKPSNPAAASNSTPRQPPAPVEGSNHKCSADVSYPVLPAVEFENSKEVDRAPNGTNALGFDTVSKRDRREAVDSGAEGSDSEEGVSPSKQWSPYQRDIGNFQDSRRTAEEDAEFDDDNSVEGSLSEDDLFVRQSKSPDANDSDSWSEEEQVEQSRAQDVDEDDDMDDEESVVSDEDGNVFAEAAEVPVDPALEEGYSNHGFGDNDTMDVDEVEAEAEAKVEADVQEVQHQAKAEAEAEALAQTEVESEADVQAKAQAQAEVEAEAQAQTEAEAEADVQSQAQAEAEAEAELQARAAVEAEAKAKAQAQADAEAKAEAEVQTQAEAEAEAEAEVQLQAQTQALAEAEAQAQAKAEAEAKVEFETQAEAEAEAKANAEAEAEMVDEDDVSMVQARTSENGHAGNGFMEVDDSSFLSQVDDELTQAPIDTDEDDTTSEPDVPLEHGNGPETSQANSTDEAEDTRDAEAEMLDAPPAASGTSDASPSIARANSEERQPLRSPGLVDVDKGARDISDHLSVGDDTSMVPEDAPEVGEGLPGREEGQTDDLRPQHSSPETSRPSQPVGQDVSDQHDKSSAIAPSSPLSIQASEDDVLAASSPPVSRPTSKDDNRMHQLLTPMQSQLPGTMVFQSEVIVEEKIEIEIMNSEGHDAYILTPSVPEEHDGSPTDQLVADAKASVPEWKPEQEDADEQTEKGESGKPFHGTYLPSFVDTPESPAKQIDTVDDVDTPELSRMAVDRKSRSEAHVVGSDTPEDQDIEDEQLVLAGEGSAREYPEPSLLQEPGASSKDPVEEEITVKTRSRQRREPSHGADANAGPDAAHVDLSVYLARQAVRPRPSRSKKTSDAQPLRTSPRAPRTRSSSLQMSATPELDEDTSVGLAKAALASPSKAGSDSATRCAALKTQLTKDLRKSLPECAPLKTLRNHIDKFPNVIAIVTTQPPKPTRAKGGPREYMMSFHITDQSIGPTQVAEVQLYRPHKESLPVVKPGDAILLQRFQVKSISNKGVGLRTASESAWAVFDSDGGAPQIKGPPVEDAANYSDHMTLLRAWYRSLDSVAKGKLDKANKKFEDLNHAN